MFEEILPKIFRMRIPMPQFEGLSHLNSYLVKGNERNLLIDTGPPTNDAFHELNKGLREVGAKLDGRTDVMTTHSHIDHIGLLPKMKAAGISNFMLSSEGFKLLEELVKNPSSHMKELLEIAKSNGVPKELTEIIAQLPPRAINFSKYEKVMKSITLLKDGDELKTSDYTFTVIKTPGHSPGHTCFYEPKTKLIISGDHLLENTTPSVIKWRKKTNPLHDYIESLKKVRRLDVDMVLPGHGNPFKTHSKRVD